MSIDLGQQYVDFFAYFRDTLLHHPENLFYTFQKSIGGEMLSVWAYYLLSPFNVILLILPKSTITFGIFLITVLKYATAALTFSWFFQKQYHEHSIFGVVLAVTYALMGWMVANQLNILWTDVLWVLPLVVRGIFNIFEGRGWRLYTLSFALALLMNFYMA